MSNELLNKLRAFFYDYSNSFKSGESLVDENIELKQDHTEKVVQNIQTIGVSIGLNEEELFEANIIALLHDIGRFPQFAKYKTFSDEKSENHAELSVQIINDQNLLSELDEKNKELILKVISHHNKLELPTKEDATVLKFSHLLRDADKLDVLRVLTECVKSKNPSKNDVVFLDLPDKNDISDKVFKRLTAHLPAIKEDLKTRADFKLMLMSWAYDMYFRKSYQIISQSQYIQKVFETLPKNDKVLSLYRQIKIHIENKLM
ncbi:MAG: HD domain-containing protein [Bacteroidota bacterium]|nr:HD domain-containing protein [Bacteroidota bacterium]